MSRTYYLYSISPHPEDDPPHLWRIVCLEDFDFWKAIKAAFKEVSSDPALLQEWIRNVGYDPDDASCQEHLTRPSAYDLMGIPGRILFKHGILRADMVDGEDITQTHKYTNLFDEEPKE